MNLRLVAKIVGAMLALFCASMVVAVPFAIAFQEWVALVALVESMAIGFLASTALLVFGWRTKGEPYRRESLAIVGLTWITAAAFGTLPFMLSGAIPHPADALFESMSGLTTTGASILGDIESLPKSILLWRSFLHYLGGLGIIVLFVSILPLLGVGGRGLFKQEVPGPAAEGITPRIKDTAIALWKLYTALNIIQAIILMTAGMSFYDAINHAMSTMATGGFSTRDASVGAFQSAVIDWIIIIFMFIAGTNFTLHLNALRGRFGYHKDPEFRVYACMMLAFVVMATFLVHYSPDAARSEPTAWPIRDAAFTVISIQTTSGFGTVDFETWPDSLHIMLLLLMFTGGCAGSTSGAMKIIRWVILFKVARHHLAMNVHPRRVQALKLGGKTIDPEIVRGVQTFYFLWFSLVFAAAFFLAVLMPDQSFQTSLSAVVSTLNNIGPGFEGVGPTKNYGGQSAAGKVLLSLLMLIGRLEVYAVVVLFSPRFWTGE